MGTRSRIHAGALAFLLSLALLANAQTPEQANKLNEFLLRSGSELGNAKSNLLEMTAGLQSPDSDRAMMIIDSASDAQCSFTQLTITSALLAMMVDSRDQASVRKMNVVITKSSVRTSINALRIINREMAKIQSQAAVSESRKLRDLIQAIRDEIQRTVPENQQ